MQCARTFLLTEPLVLSGQLKNSQAFASPNWKDAMRMSEKLSVRFELGICKDE